MKELTGRSPMKSPGAPSHRREIERAFWGEVARGLSSENAATAVGVSPAVGARWFRHRGGMSPFTLAPLTGRYLSFAEREEIALCRVQGTSVRGIARATGRSPSTISRELRRNAATRGGKLEYRASVAQWKSEIVAQRPKTVKLLTNDLLRDYVQDRLSGAVKDANGAPITGPTTQTWKGRNKPHRQDRRWATVWSPEQIAGRLRIDYPHDLSMRISHEAIYQALYVQSRGALTRDLVANLRTGRSLRVPRSRARHRPGGHVTADVMIDKRPTEVAAREVPGHWEGDLIIGTDGSAIGTLVERMTKVTMLIHLPAMEGYGVQPRVKNGPALAGHGAEATRKALVIQMSTLPAAMRRSLTWDRGKELAQHVEFTKATGIAVYFADAHSPWQRPLNENTNGLLRQYFPKGTDLARWGTNELDAVALTLNNRPRKILGWKTPTEIWAEHLLLTEQAGVASTS
ncbi:IS30 family transposase [Cryobacterium ruanii]|uniref:IS30 family transposase n=1 Tax=Cryobacterium ruanii TaxID=1259197 RepID=A0A4R9AMS1_9MICO|nr:IS30 family transposase [Cryobacterium ruanii]TFD66311.1 IS30 family transposase [Cryobacterium ruanii]